MVFLELVTLIVGMALIAFSSSKTVEYSSHIAATLKVPAIVMGVVLVSLGTDIPEIANSIFSSYTNHGDINVGNTLGSSLSQISLVLALVAILGGVVKARRRNIMVLGGCAIVAVTTAALVVADGSLSRIDALALLVVYAILLAITVKFSVREHGIEKMDVFCPTVGTKNCIAFLILSIIGVIAGAAIIVNSVIKLSAEIGLPEYLISFFIVGIGTSLPELSVELAAIRKKQYGIFLGDLMGSNITDATFALGIGPLLFPTAVSAGLIIPLSIYVIAASLVIVALFAWRKKIDKYAALVLIFIYLLSFIFIR
jgi:cation:H+ antiporter